MIVLPPARIGEMVAAEFLGETWTDDLPLEGDGPLEVPMLTIVGPPPVLELAWCTPATNLSLSGVVWFEPIPVGVPLPLPTVDKGTVEYCQ